MLLDFLISYHFLIIILQRSPKYFPLLPDFSNPLSLSFREVRSTFLCYRTSQTPYLNRPVIPQGPKHSSLLSDFIVILSFRSVCQLCGWTVPRLVRGTCGAFRTSFVISPRYYVCYGPWSGRPVRGTIHAVGSMSVRPVRSTIHALGCLSNCPFRRVLSFVLSFALSPFVCPFSFHLPFLLPFRLPFPFPFLSYPPPDLGENYF